MSDVASAGAVAPHKVVVGIADLKFSQDPGESIITYALGSCLGITVYDAVARVGGLLHLMMPDSTIDPEKAAENPYKFVDTGVPLLFKGAYKLGAEKSRLVVKVAGGSNPLGGGENDFFQIGRRNMTALRKLLFRNGVLIKGEDVGGSDSRTMTLEMATGAVTLKLPGGERAL
jgi:chemotaxis protein CheD